MPEVGGEATGGGSKTADRGMDRGQLRGLQSEGVWREGICRRLVIWAVCLRHNQTPSAASNLFTDDSKQHFEEAKP